MATVVLCCSLTQLPAARRLAGQLRRAGADVVTPEPAPGPVPAPGSSRYLTYRRRVCAEYFAAITARDTVAVVAVNAPAAGRAADYIEATTFGELAAAASAGKPVYVTHRFPAAYAEDLRIYGACELHGNPAPLVAFAVGS